MALLQFEPLDAPFGVAAYGVDLASGVDSETFRALADALYANRILVIKDQHCDTEAYLAFGRQWGTPIRHVQEKIRLNGHPDLVAVGNVTRDPDDDIARNGAAFWHTDQSYESDIATATMLYAITMPATGGETRIADMKAAYDDLGDAMKQRIEGLSAIHGYGAASGRDGERPVAPLSPEQAALVPPVRHPLVRRHGVTGEKALYAVAGTPITVDGLPESEANELLATLKAHAVQDKYVHEHRYSVGDIAIWDTQMTLHSAKPIGRPEPGNERLLWRISVRGTPAVYS
ncbi:MAG: hypothetical protein CMM50_04565 [Rhodospirillaceae bacterium]|nr:hypothetical protein [Rhodospirillaceae bacterium]